VIDGTGGGTGGGGTTRRNAGGTGTLGCALARVG
jgi:hypothetical protein